MPQCFHCSLWIHRYSLVGALVLLVLFQPIIAKAVQTEPNAWLGLGVRQDRLDWNIAGDINGSNPNVISDLKWTNLATMQLQGGFEMLWQDKLFVRGHVGYGQTRSGDNQDSDYAYDNRQGEISRSNNPASGGYMADASIGIGLPIYMNISSGERLHLIPLLGLASNVQRVKMGEGVQTVSDTSTARNAGLIGPTESIPPVGTPLAGLDARYTATWSGLWLGADVDYRLRSSDRLLARFELHKANLYGEGDWNLRTDFEHPRSYEHIADGRGWLMMLGWQTTLESHWYLRLSYTLQSWRTDTGLIRFFRTDGSRPEQQLNEVNWQSRVLSLSISYAFSQD